MLLFVLWDSMSCMLYLDLFGRLLFYISKQFVVTVSYCTVKNMRYIL